MLDEAVAVDYFVHANLPPEGRGLHLDADLLKEGLRDDLMTEAASEKLDAWVYAIYD